MLKFGPKVNFWVSLKTLIHLDFSRASVQWHRFITIFNELVDTIVFKILGAHRRSHRVLHKEFFFFGLSYILQRIWQPLRQFDLELEGVLPFLDVLCEPFNQSRHSDYLSGVPVHFLDFGYTIKAQKTPFQAYKF